jgi:DNA-binding NarL/FixJ family response regulator
MDLKTVGINRWKELAYHQLDILQHVAMGYTARQIGESMGCRAQSISNQLQTIYAKLNVHKRKDAVQLAVKQGFLPDSIVSTE